MTLPLAMKRQAIFFKAYLLSFLKITYTMAQEQGHPLNFENK